MTMERRIAGKARALVSQRKDTDAEHKKETAYRALCESFPMLLRSAGLAQAVAFLKAKKQPEYVALYDDVQQQFEGLQVAGSGNLAEAVTGPQLSLADYRLYSEIAMQIALWHKRLAQATLRQKEKR